MLLSLCAKEPNLFSGDMYIQILVAKRTPHLRDQPKGQLKGVLSKEVVSDDGEFSMGHMYVYTYCDQ